MTTRKVVRLRVTKKVVRKLRGKFLPLWGASSRRSANSLFADNDLVYLHRRAGAQISAGKWNKKKEERNKETIGHPQ